jgi:hypothetical protein
VSLAPFESAALAFVQSKLGILDIKTVILDDWSGIRLIYETGDVRRCTNDCAHCRTYLTLGEDQKPPGDFLRTTLVKASDDHTDVTRNRMLNCKTTADYQSSFVQWLQRRCRTLEEFREELTLVRNFRVVYSSGASGDELRALERSLRVGIVEAAKREIEERRALFDQAVREVFSPW